ncbi:MAG: response regulator [Christensenellales bacterium]|jgi:two-component system KDP operon response regulator KdpE
MDNKHVIMVVEDEKAIRDFLKAKLEADCYRVSAVSSGKEAILLAASHCPDLILLDLGLPDMDGMEVLKSIRGWSAVPVVVVSARQQEADIVSALDHGADDYVTKPFSNSVLMARVRTALRKGTALKTDNTLLNQYFDLEGLRIDYDRRLVTVDGGAVHLTPIEYRILVLLAVNSGRVLTYEFFRRELWGPYGGDNRTLRVNMANLRRKIEKNPADPQYILTEIGVGYRMTQGKDTPQAKRALP